MTDQVQTQELPQMQATQPQVQQTKNGKGAWFWILAVLGGVLLLCICCCSLFTIAAVTSPEFKDGFSEGYCEQWLAEGADPDADPFDICVGY